MGILDKFASFGSKKKSKKTQPVKKEAKKDKDQVKPEKSVKKEEYSSIREKGSDLGPEVTKEKQGKKSKKNDTRDAYKVLIRPLITEKATDLSTLGKYCFEVSRRSNKIEVKKAIKSLYNVEVEDVNIINNRGKRVRYGRVTGKQRNWKKAIVTLKEGDKIELYEGV